MKLSKAIPENKAQQPNRSDTRIIYLTEMSGGDQRLNKLFASTLRVYQYPPAAPGGTRPHWSKDV